MADRQRTWIDEHMDHQRELGEKRRAWEESRKAQADAKRLHGLREEMDTYRDERLTDWMEHGGDEATFRQVWPQMQKDYLDGKQLEREAERAERLAQAEAEHYDRLY